MDPFRQDPVDRIRITRDEAMSSHVDDLIKRQRSLRGEGVTRDRGRRWYYQNWVVFMMVGCVAAMNAPSPTGMAMSTHMLMRPSAVSAAVLR